MQTIQEFIFSEEFELLVDTAIEHAVARANAAGLPKAYLDSFADLPLSMPACEDDAADH